MTSNLFQLASKAERRLAKQTFVAHPSVGLYKSLGRAGHGNTQQFMRRLRSPEARDLMRNLEHGRRGSAAKYSKKDDQEQLNRLLGLLGPLGDVIRAAVGEGSTRDFSDGAMNAAVNLVRSMGAEVLTKRGQPGYERGLEAAHTILEDAGYTVTPPRTVAAEGDDVEWGNAAGTTWLHRNETQTNSTNVFSFAWSQETDNYGTLYVTFRAWSPGMKKAGVGAGATYAYHAVPLQKYRAFARACKSSAGSAVWDYLRVRGSVSDHQHPYELVGGVLINPNEVYIPRKATEVGYFRRSVEVSRNGRGSWQRSSLASREFAPGRAEPNRGEPNRGGPNRGR